MVGKSLEVGGVEQHWGKSIRSLFFFLLREAEDEMVRQKCQRQAKLVLDGRRRVRSEEVDL